MEESRREARRGQGRNAGLGALAAITAVTGLVMFGSPASAAGASGRTGDPEAAALLMNRAVSAKAGLHISFDLYQGRTDGFSFFLVDGAQPAAATTAKRQSTAGLPGTPVVGFDVSGLGAAVAKGAAGGPNSVVVHAIDAGGTQFLAGGSVAEPLPAVSAESAAKGHRTVTIDVTSVGQMSVSVDFHDGNGPRTIVSDLELAQIKGLPKLPQTVKLGIVAKKHHAVRNVNVTALLPDLRITVTPAAPLRKGRPGGLDLSVTDDPTGGPTTGRVTSTFVVPAGMAITSATGAGWTCGVTGQKITCTRPGSHADALAAGRSYPPIKVNVQVQTGAPNSVAVQPVVDTAGNRAADGRQAPTIIPIAAPAGPAPVPTPVASLPSAPAKPSSAPAPVPSGKPGAVLGSPAPVPVFGAPTPGASAPGSPAPSVPAAPSPASPAPVGPAPVSPSPGVSVPAVPAPVVSVPAQGKPGSAPAPAPPAKPGTVPVAPPPAKPGAANGPNLSTTVTHVGTPTEGKPTTYTVAVANDKTAGPTTAPVTTAFTVPAGQKLNSAAGTGWTCAISGQSATCTRPGGGTGTLKSDALKPGASFPPIKVTVTMPAGSAGHRTTPTVTTSTKSGAAPASRAAKPDPATIAAAKAVRTSLRVGIMTSPDPYKKGGTVTYTTTVSNAGPDAANGTRLVMQLPDIWSRVAWTCRSIGGASCPSRTGFGSFDTKISVPKGGRLLLTAARRLPASFTGTLVGQVTLVPPAGAIDTTCTPTGCTSSNTNSHGSPPSPLTVFPEVF